MLQYPSRGKSYAEGDFIWLYIPRENKVVFQITEDMRMSISGYEHDVID